MIESRNAYEHCGPSCGTLGGHFRVDPESFLGAAGYDPDAHPEVVEELRQALPEAVVDAAYQVMREHGLKPETDPTAPIHVGPLDANEVLALRVLAAVGFLGVGQWVVVADGDTGCLRFGPSYSSAQVARAQATRIANRDGVPTYMVYRHRDGKTIYLDRDTILYTQPAEVTA